MFYTDEPIQILCFTCECENEFEEIEAFFTANEQFTKLNKKMTRDYRLREQEKEIIDLKIENLQLKKKLIIEKLKDE